MHFLIFYNFNFGNAKKYTIIIKERVNNFCLITWVLFIIKSYEKDNDINIVNLTSYSTLTIESK